MTVPARYILAALAFGVAALGFLLLPVEADARSQSDRPQCTGASGCGGHQPPPCNHGCNPPPPPPPPRCCDRPVVVVPPPHVPPPNIVVVNAGARASASASAIAIAVANVDEGDTIIRQNMLVEGNVAATAHSAAFAITEGSMSMEATMRERRLRIQAICIDTTDNPHPASQTFGGEDVRDAYRGEIFRCMSGTRMRYTLDGRSYDCEQGQALWYENGRLECRTQIARRPCNERSLLRRFGAGEKVIVIRDTEMRETRTETTFNGSMTMDGGVGGGAY
jgi:hypothetical protein